MATVYKVEVVSHWLNFSEEFIEQKIKDALMTDGNEVSVKVNKQ